MGDGEAPTPPTPTPPTPSSSSRIVVAIPLFDRFTALDAVGPYELLHTVPGVEVLFLGQQAGELFATARKDLKLVTTASFEDVPSPDIVVVPGGPGCFAAADDPALITWLLQAHRTSLYTTSVCTGSMILASAGLLNGLEATTHWRRYGELAKLGAIPTDKRVVKQGKIITSAGVSSGIDMALHLIAAFRDEETAKMVQLFMEYDPQPPYDAGCSSKAGEEIIAKTLELAKGLNRNLDASS